MPVTTVYSGALSAVGQTVVRLTGSLGRTFYTGTVATGQTVVSVVSTRRYAATFTATGQTVVRVNALGHYKAGATAAGKTVVFVRSAPDLSDNPVTAMGLHLRGDFVLTPAGNTDPGLASPTAARAIPLVVLSTTAPAIAQGKPVTPKNWAKLSSSISVIEGANHIRAVANPNPVWNPATSGWYTPPPPQRFAMTRWTVDTLPDPPTDGFYWLGDPSSSDGTVGSSSGTHQWAAAPGSIRNSPAWRSFFPYKPSVTAYDSYIPGFGAVHHPKGVNFNSHFIEHMWMNWDRDHVQPFTWIIAGMTTGSPIPHFRHYILDAGQNPDTVGFPRLTADQVNTPRQIGDTTPYRTLLAVDDATMVMSTRLAQDGVRVVKAPYRAQNRPKMWFGVFDSTTSYLGYFDIGGKIRQLGAVDDGANQHHKYYLLGRRHGWMAQNYSSQMLLFELRFIEGALDLTELLDQFKQLASTYQFDKYRTL